jgi:hypothetical protein
MSQIKKKPWFPIPEILAWADAHHKRTGEWPKSGSGPLLDGPLGENWRRVDNALRHGLRGLPGGSSLAQLLDEQRGVRNVHDLPSLTEEQILTWADSHHERTDQWPNENSGPVIDANEETWYNLDAALRQGLRGFPGGSSLARFLEEHRGVPNRLNVPRLTIKKILAWADAHHRSTGQWPKLNSGEIDDGDTWAAVEAALVNGSRGLPGGSSLAKVLAKHRGVRNKSDLPPLTREMILAWADSHHRLFGQWPKARSGQVANAPGESWKGVEMALIQGLQGLPGGSSLAKMLAEERGVRNPRNLARLTIAGILAWTDTHFRRTGQWPVARSGQIHDAPGETWMGVERALYRGHRGLPGGSSIARLLRKHRRVVRKPGRCPAQ